jgi:hypothetical protein
MLVNLVLAAPLVGATDFLVSAAGHSSRIGLSVVVALVSSRALALWLVALAAVGLAVAAAENVSLMSMLSLSEAYARAGAPDRGQFLVPALALWLLIKGFRAPGTGRDSL